MDENKLSVDENKNIISIYNVGHEHERSDNETVIAREGKLRNIYINNFLIFCFWCSSRKRNINKILFLFFLVYLLKKIRYNEYVYQLTYC